MDYYIIPPRKALALSHLGDNRYFCLAQQYIKDAAYREFFQSLPSSAWITLDNGAGDHEMVSAQQLLEVALELKPNEVIPPDELFNGPQTILNLMDFIKLKKKHKHLNDTQIFFCPQGSTFTGWLDCYKYGLTDPDVHTLGLSKIGVPYMMYKVKGDIGIMEARHSVFNYLKINDLLKKPIHLLGMGDPREFEYYAKYDTDKIIRSNDSCNAIWSALNNISWKDGNFERIPTPKDYFDLVIPPSDVESIEFNVQFLKDSV